MQGHICLMNRKDIIMSNNCKYCGNHIDSEAEVCTECSEKNNQAAAQAEQTAEKKPYIQVNTDEIKKGMTNAAEKVADKEKEVADATKSVIENKKIGTQNIIIALSAAAAIVIMIIVLVACLTPAYAKPIEYFVTGMEKDSYKTLKKAFPEFVIDEFEDSYYSIEDVLENLHEEAEDEYGKKFKISYKITRKSKLDDDDLEDIEDAIDDYYDEDVRVSAGYELKVKLKISGGGDSDNEKIEVNVYKIDGKWHLMSMPSF